MRKSYRTFMIVALVVCVSGGVLVAQDRERGGGIRGVFVRLTERRVGERGYMGIVVKPFESDEHVTVLVPREYEEIARSARTLREGDRLEISFVTAHEEMWIKGMEAVRRQEQGERDPDGGRRVEIRREVRREPEREEERRERERRMDVPREMRREADRMEERREGGRWPEARRDERPPREPSPHEQLQGQLRDVIARHMEHMGMELREILAFNIERMQAELHELRAHVENMHREMEELRHENEMLRRQLQETNELRREDDREARERRELDRRRDEGERREREILRERELVERMETERQEGRERDERDIPRDGDRDEGR